MPASDNCGTVPFEVHESMVGKKSKPPRAPTAKAWTHVRAGPGGAESAMVDVSAKAVTQREATASAVVCFPAGLLQELLDGRGPKGPLTEVARVAGILAAKNTGQLIPMCHPLAIDAIEVNFSPLDDLRLEVRCRVACTGRTGVEMEALVGASMAALTVYDMSKARAHGIEIESVRLLEKRGGRSGHWVHPRGEPS